MRRPLLTILATLAICAPFCAMALFEKIGKNRSLEQRLASHPNMAGSQATDRQAEAGASKAKASRAKATTMPEASRPKEASQARFDQAVADVEEYVALGANEMPHIPRFLLLLEAVKGLSASQMIEIARRTPEFDHRDLLLIAAQQDPEAVLENEELLDTSTKYVVLATLGRSDPLGALNRLPPIDPEKLGTEVFQDPDIKLRIHLATLAMGVDLDAGLRSFLEARSQDSTKTDKMRPVAAVIDSGRAPLPEESVPGLIAAMDDPEFQPIRDDLIKMTLDHYLYTNGVTAAAEQARSMPLTPDELKLYVESLKMYDIMKIEPLPTMEWVSTALPVGEQIELVPDLFLDWVKRDAVAARDWLDGQPPSPVRDETIANFATTAPSLDRASAADWALEIHNGEIQARTVLQVVEEWRQEDASAAALWIEQKEIE